MTLKREHLFGLALAAVGAVLAWALFVALPGGSDGETGAPLAEGAEGGESARTTDATLFYIAENGLTLVAVDREVMHSDRVTEQARRILEEQLKPAPAPYVSAVPEGTTLKALYVTDRGEAFVDLSAEVTENHPGGSLDELFTIYAVVNAVTANLSSITAVQILVAGKEVDTLAGHVDLRHPLRENLAWVQQPGGERSVSADNR